VLRKVSITTRLLVLGAAGILAAVVIGGAALVEGAQVDRSRAEAAAISAANVGVTAMDVEHANSQIATRDAMLGVGANRAADALAEEADAEQNVADTWRRVSALALPDDIRNQVTAMHAALEQYLAQSRSGLPTVARSAPGSPQVKVALDALLVRVKAVDDTTTATEDLLSAREHQDDLSLAAATRRLRLIVITMLVIGVLLVAAVSIVIARSINRPLRRLRDRLAEVSHGGGDLTARLDVDGRDDLTQIAHLFNRFVDSVAGTVRLIAEVSQTFAASTQRLGALSAQLGRGAADTTAGVEQATTSAREVAGSVGSMSAATEQLTASIGEIAAHAASAAGVATSAVSTVAETSAAVTELAAASGEIGEIVRTITAIAEQTNLLALNATIEAARAGDAGKGFAVVATEVKELAGETSTATDDITRKITTIQETTARASEAMNRISSVIDNIHAMQATIAAAVEEQSSTTAEMSRNVAGLATGADEVAGNLQTISSTAAAADLEAADAGRHAADLAALSQRLQDTLRQFTY
jgi:methyl-accepting chemotaxis protein